MQETVSFDNLSNRSKNALAKAKIFTVEQLMELSEDQLWNLPNMGAKSVKEVLDFRKAVGGADYVPVALVSEEDSTLENAYGQKDISVDDVLYIYNDRDCSDVKADELPFGVRVMNVLNREGISTLAEICDRPYFDFLHMENLGKKSFDEILDVVKNNTKIKETSAFSSVSVGDVANTVDVESGETKLRPNASLLCNAYNDFGLSVKDVDFIWDGKLCLDIPTDGLAMSPKVKHAIELAGIEKFSEFCQMTLKQYKEIPGVGSKALTDAFDCVRANSRLHSNGVEGESSQTGSSEDLNYAKKIILAYLDKYGSSDAERLRAYCRENELEHYGDALLSLIEDEDIKFSEERYFVTYPTFEEYVSTLPKDKTTDILYKRASGMTLDGIGKEYGLTRERVRQIISKQLKKFPHLSEDRFRGIVGKYDFDEESATWILGINSLGYGYLAMRDTSKSEGDIADILDEDIPAPVKKRAEEYIYRDYIDIDGVKVKKNRHDILMYVCMTRCTESKTQEEIITYYNDFLKEHHLDSDPDYEYTDRYFEVNMVKSKSLLTSYNRRLRYHSELSQEEFDEFLEDIHFSDLNDVEVSTKLFLDEYPDVMEEYDIQDEYELHNLLRKNLKDDRVKFSRMPMIGIGDFDRDKQIVDLLFEVAPVTVDEFTAHYHEKYGVDRTTVLANYTQPIKVYLSDGVYRVDYEELTDEEHFRLKGLLTESFHSFDVIRTEFLEMFPDSEHKLNRYNLSKIGYDISGNTIFETSTYKSFDDFLRNKVFEEGFVDLSDKLWFMQSTTVYMIVTDMRRNLDYVEYDRLKYISIQELEKRGITKDLLNDFSDKAFRYVNGHPFTYISLRNDGFSHPLMDKDLPDYFYSTVLQVHVGSYSTRIGEYPGKQILMQEREKISTLDLIRDVLEEFKSIRLDDLLSHVSEKYGITLDRYKVTNQVEMSRMYYSKSLRKLYLDYSLFLEDNVEDDYVY